MGKHVNGKVQNVISIITVCFISTLSVILLVSSVVSAAVR
jgi:Mn2+/Fe2+ NRAMP family transporter